MNLNDLKTSLLYDFSSESELIKSIEEISLKFTAKREDIGDYLKDPKLVSAYACFYLTTNLPKLAEVFEKISFPMDRINEFEFVDIGTGPGTFLLALHQIEPNLSLIGIETAELMRDQANAILKGQGLKNFKVVSKSKEVNPKLKNRVGIFSHSANEMSLKQIKKYIEDLELDIVLFIEPGTKDFFRKSLEIREELIRSEFTIKYPCPNQGGCPMVQKDDWCHQYIKVSHDSSVERISQMAQKDRRLLPLTIHLYSRIDFGMSSCHARLVRVYRPTKFSTEWQICENKGEKNILTDLQIMNRGMKKKQIKEMQSILAGVEVSYKVEKVVDGKTRGTLVE